MRVIVGDEDRVYRPGETFEVPAGTPHQMGTGEPTTMRWKVRRALRTAEFFEGLYGSGPDSARELGQAFFEIGAISWLGPGNRSGFPSDRPWPLPSRSSAPG